MSDVLLASGIFALAGLVQSLAGFGFGMVSMAILPIILPVRSAVPVVALLGGSRRRLDFRACLGEFLAHCLDPGLKRLPPLG